MTSKRWTLIITLCALTMFIVSCGAPNYSDSDLMKLSAKTITGIITKQGRGSFVIQDKNGVDAIYNTGQITQYLPQLYRSQKNDEVRVTFKESWGNNGKLKRSVYQLESIHVPEQNKAPSEAIEGTIVVFNKGSSKYISSMIFQTDSREEPYLIYIPKSKPIFKLNGKYLETSIYTSSVKTNIGGSQSYVFEEHVGSTAKASFKHAPILRGNAYVFEATEVVIKPTAYDY